MTKCHQTTDALFFLRQDRSKYHIILTADHIDGFNLLRIVSSEMNNLPVMMVSSDGNPDTILRAISLGCCEHLEKPINKDSLRNIWQHVLRKRRNELSGIETIEEARKRIEDNNASKPQQEQYQEGKGLVGEIESNHVLLANNNNNNGGQDHHETNFSADHVTQAPKKFRLVWTPELHDTFQRAVNQIGYERAVPKKILEIMLKMGCDKDITRENIASHLQKYRMYHSKTPSPSLSANNNISHELETSSNTSMSFEPCGNNNGVVVDQSNYKGVIDDQSYYDGTTFDQFYYNGCDDQSYYHNGGVGIDDQEQVIMGFNNYQIGECKCCTSMEIMDNNVSSSQQCNADGDHHMNINGYMNINNNFTLLDQYAMININQGCHMINNIFSGDGDPDTLQGNGSAQAPHGQLQFPPSRF